MERSVTFCDHCGIQMREANHWWRLARILGPRIMIMPHELPAEGEGAVVLDLCGERCVMAQVAEFMGKPKDEKGVIAE